jgi:hypothetical protein
MYKEVARVLLVLLRHYLTYDDDDDGHDDDNDDDIILYIIFILYRPDSDFSYDTFLTMMENTALRRVPVGTLFQPDGEPPHVSRRVCVSLDRGCLISG